MPLNDLHRRVATIALRAARRHGFALGGGNALIVPQYVLKALITMIAERGVTDPVTPAIRLLPYLELSV